MKIFGEEKDPSSLILFVHPMVRRDSKIIHLRVSYIFNLHIIWRCFHSIWCCLHLLHPFQCSGVAWFVAEKDLISTIYTNFKSSKPVDLEGYPKLCMRSILIFISLVLEPAAGINSLCQGTGQE